MFNALRIAGFILSALRKASIFLGVTKENTSPLAFVTLGSDYVNIERYLGNLVNGYNARGAGVMGQHRITELRHCRQHMGREYVLAKVVDLENHFSFYIAFELSWRTNAQDSNTATSPLRGHLNNHDAFLASTPTRPGIFDEICEAVKFNKTPPPLYEVAVLAFTVHKLQADHNFSDASAHLYATTIMEAMKALYNPISDKKLLKLLTSIVGRMPRFEKRPFHRTFSKTKIDAKTLDGIIDSYNVDLQKFVDDVRSATFVRSKADSTHPG